MDRGGLFKVGFAWIISSEPLTGVVLCKKQDVIVCNTGLVRDLCSVGFLLKAHHPHIIYQLYHVIHDVIYGIT